MWRCSLRGCARVVESSCPLSASPIEACRQTKGAQYGSICRSSVHSENVGRAVAMLSASDSQNVQIKITEPFPGRGQQISHPNYRGVSMGKPRARWQPYAIGQYKLGRLKGQAIVHWRSNERSSDGRRKRPRFRLYNKDGTPACSERDARAALAAWVAEQEA